MRFKNRVLQILTTPTGEISMGDINTELSTTGERSMGQADGRDLAGVPTGEITMTNYQGKSSWEPLTYVKVKVETTSATSRLRVYEFYKGSDTIEELFSSINISNNFINKDNAIDGDLETHANFDTTETNGALEGKHNTTVGGDYSVTINGELGTTVKITWYRNDVETYVRDISALGAKQTFTRNIT